MGGCKGGLHLLYVVGLCGSFKLRVSFQDCLGIPGTKRESGKYMEICYAQRDWHNAQEAKAHQARIHNPGRTAWLHKLQHNTSLLTPYFGHLTSLCYMIIVCSLYSTLCPAHVPLNRTSEAVLGYSHIFAVQDAMGTLFYIFYIALHSITEKHLKSLHMAYIMAQRITPNDTTLPGIVGCFMTCHCSRVGFHQLLPTSFNLMWRCVSSDT